MRLTRRIIMKIYNAYDLSAEAQAELLAQHNAVVKPEYEANLAHLIEWLDSAANFEEEYVEIASNETRSGHAVILDW
jgi:phosphoserine aminotransferase